MTAELFDAARARLAATGFDAAAQTRISTFIRTAKAVNIALLGRYAGMPVTQAAQVHVHSQLFRETEAASLLARTTRWSMEPAVLIEATCLALPLWTALSGTGMGWPAADARASVRGLALGHALLGQVRVTPCIPPTVDESDPYVLALRRIDADNGRLIQLQTRLLAFAADAVPEAQALVDEQQSLVKAAYAALLESLARC